MSRDCWILLAPIRLFNKMCLLYTVDIDVACMLTVLGKDGVLIHRHTALGEAVSTRHAVLALHDSQDVDA